MNAPKFRSYSFKTKNTETIEAVIDAPGGALVVKRAFFPKGSKEKLYVELWDKGYVSACLKLDRTIKAQPGGVLADTGDSMPTKQEAETHLAIAPLFAAFPEEFAVWEAVWAGSTPGRAGDSPPDQAPDDGDIEDVLPASTAIASDPLAELTAGATSSDPLDDLVAAALGETAPTTLPLQAEQDAIPLIDDSLFEEAMCQMEPLEDVKIDPEDFGTL